MVTKNKIIVFMFFLTLLSLGGCANYHSRPLNKLTTTIPTNLQEQFLSFSYHIFNKADCLKFLDRDVISKGYQPMHICITNHTSRPFYMSLSNFSLPCASAFDVAKLVHTSTTKRVAGYGILGLFLWPFLIPAVIDGISSSEANKNLDIDFERKALDDQSISPFSAVDGLIFVPMESFNQQFSLVLIDQETHERFTLTPIRPKFKLKNNSEFIKQIENH